jgi:hypothetical protein
MSRARDLGSLINSTAAGKNLIINGGFDFWQRGTTVSAAGSQYLADRWNTYRGAYAAGLTVSRQLVSDSTNLPNLTYCIRMQRDSGNTATNALGLAYNAESVDSKLYAGKTVTLSFYARAGASFISNGQQIRATIITGTGQDQAIRNGLTGMAFTGDRFITLTDTWVRYSVTGNLASTITQVSLAIDGYVSGTAGASDYFEITGVQLEVGSSATPFSRAGGDMQGELAKCQRYYYRTDSLTNGQTTFGYGEIYNSTLGLFVIRFPVTMRTAPSMPAFIGSGVGFVVGATVYASSALSLNQATVDSVLIQGTISGGVVTSGNACRVTANGNTNNIVAFQAEL